MHIIHTDCKQSANSQQTVSKQSANNRRWQQQPTSAFSRVAGRTSSTGRTCCSADKPSCVVPRNTKSASCGASTLRAAQPASRVVSRVANTLPLRETK